MDEEGVKYLSENLGYNYVYYPIAKNDKLNLNFGNAVLSKRKILEHRKVILPHEKSDNGRKRHAVFCKTKFNDRAIWVCSAHTETTVMSRRKRLDQRLHIMKYINMNIPNSEPIVNNNCQWETTGITIGDERKPQHSSWGQKSTGFLGYYDAFQVDISE